MPESMRFDYVVVGAGSAGCVLANRLSEDPDVTVAVLEAGPPDRSPFIHVPLGLIRAMVDPKINWMFYSAPQKSAEGRAIFMPRGMTLGGSSSINGMVYIRGNPRDYDEWAEAGNPGWSWLDVKPYFLKSENNEQYQDEHHGTGGPLNVTFIPDPSPVHETLIAAVEQLQHRHNRDFNGAAQDGFGIHQVTQKNGRRWSAAKAFLEPARTRSNLEILTDAPVARVLIEQGRATGVAVMRRDGEQMIHANREVVLAAGAITSPKILMLSGVGDGAALKAAGVGVVHDLPGVGRNLQDHASCQNVYRTRSSIPVGISARSLHKFVWAGLDYALRRRGLLASNMVEAGGFARTVSGLERPDIQFVFTPGYRARAPRILAYGHGYMMTIVLLRPKSRGAVTLAGPDPKVRPVIDPQFFDDPDDLEGLLRGFKESRRILQSGPFQRYEPTEILPGDEVATDDQLRDFIRANSATIFHPVGTCKMGSDAKAVVDTRLRVHGLDGLRVVDGSVMPTIVGGNTNAPIIMIAEKASDMIKEDARLRRAA